ncbi:hypothetical protein [Nitrobacter vulgaris]|jgi:hypothetical protein|uniref:Alpha/beta hydrolase n=1 Tax=Nitrobacter vulgaris TaxID=29421 RepID=A0A1V4HVM2_NITVU|nr:hypothetical protein [Nitrobacter vulgaris]OPH82027.1 hypothetical protein B2M20_14855 [Nitrobacter vulgaris]
MSRLAIAFMLALAATGANAQNSGSGQSQTPAAAGEDETRPFLFDGRLPGDEARERLPARDRHPSGGTIVVPPKASQPEHER